MGAPAIALTCGWTNNKGWTGSKNGLQSKAAINSASMTCPVVKQVMSIGVAADCTYVDAHGGALEALKQIISNVNQASIVYEKSFNFMLGISKIMIMEQCTPSSNDTVWNVQCKCEYTLAKRLSDFSLWRGEMASDQIGLWQLMTNCRSQPSVGIAWNGAACQAGSSAANNSGTLEYLSGTSIASVVPVEWKVVAHEIGHNFGAVHDCSTALCGASYEGCDCNPCSPNWDCQGKYCDL